MSETKKVMLTSDGKILVKGDRGIVEITDPDFLDYIRQGMTLKEIELTGQAQATVDRAYEDAAPRRLGPSGPPDAPPEETMEYISKMFPDLPHPKDPQPGKRSLFPLYHTPFGPNTPLGPEGIVEPEETVIGPCFPGPFDLVPGVPEEMKPFIIEDNGPKGDPVDHPKHYCSHPSGVECIVVAREYDFDIGNAIKYLWRHGLKSEEGKEDIDKAIEDLEKAIWYIQDEIAILEKLKKEAKSSQQD